MGNQVSSSLIDLAYFCKPRLHDLVKEECFYFNPDLPHGGPGPSRKRRAMFDESKLDVDDVHGKTELYCELFFY